MVSTLARITALLVAVGILLVGHGLQLTLLPLHAHMVGWSTSAIGLSGSSYFLGFVAGCVVIPSVVASVGHIRTFMVMAALATVALLAAGLLVSLPGWLIFRFATGFALSGLYMVIESWLAEVSAPQQRGTILAIYTVICLAGMSVGQGFMALASPLGLELFVVGAALLCLAIIPIGLARVAAPHPIPSARFSPRVLLKASRVAMACILFGGLATGAFWTIGPAVGRAFGLEAGEIGAMMSASIIGGALAQLPVGRMSDRTDRRIVIGGLFAVGATAAALGWLFADTGAWVLYLVMFWFGAATFPIYALCVAHASDTHEIPLVEVVSGVLMMNSIGSIIGAVLAATLVDWYGPETFFAFTVACLIPGCAWAFYRVAAVERPHTHEQAHIIPRTTQVVAELSPDEHFPATAAEQRTADS